jgi:L-glyceraldehyde 3-phosphate reductase
MPYRLCGRSGCSFPRCHFSSWQNFGHDRPPENSRAIVLRALDLGIRHFDPAINYGTPYGSAEE